MEEDRASELKNLAYGIFANMVGIIEDRDVDKMVICFYDLIKRTYGLAKGQDVYDSDKENIDDTLKGMLVMVKAMLTVGDWTEEMIEEFDEKVMELWVTD